ncbi:MAG TPA: eL32 family ribosomal protein [Candidatus Omnitrophota bacterium]|nr:eL32 family ribosomal protein [Candidatus Omnitrophota bacterium]
MTAKFLRRGWERYSKTGKRRKKKQVWRRPHGRDNKMREKRKGYGPVVSIGHRTAKAERGKVEEKNMIMANNVKDLSIAKSGDIVIFGKIGKKKKMEMAKTAKEKGIRVYNLNVNKFLKSAEKRK